VTTTFGWSVRTALLTSLIFPAVMLLSYLLLLPAVSLDEHGKASSGDYQRLRAEDGEEEYDSDGSTGRHTPGSSALLQQSTTSEGPAFSAYARSTTDTRSLTWAGFRNQLATTKKLVVPYMIPLFLVYFAEYVINQGVTPTLLFPLDESPFTEYRAFYPMYAALYQTGVFISRSSLPFVRIRKSLYLPSLVQVGILAMLTLHAMFPFLPSVYVVFVIILIEGLIGGLVYVSAFADIREEVPVEEREFSLGVVALADSVGILCAGVVGAALETGLCGWQIKHGRDWCHRT
jgi:battenin